MANTKSDDPMQGKKDREGDGEEEVYKILWI